MAEVLAMKALKGELLEKMARKRGLAAKPAWLQGAGSGREIKPGAKGSGKSPGAAAEPKSGAGS